MLGSSKLMHSMWTMITKEFIIEGYKTNKKYKEFKYVNINKLINKKYEYI